MRRKAKRNAVRTFEFLEPRLVLSGGPTSDFTGGPDWRQVIVQFAEDAPRTQVLAREMVGEFQGKLGHVYEHALQGFSAQLPERAIQQLQHHPWIESIEMDQIAQAHGWPSGASYLLPSGVDRIEADLNTTAHIDNLLGDGSEAPSSDSTTVDIDVAIIDTGIDFNHRELDVVDGVRYYTITTGRPSNRGTHSDDNYWDDNGHGTHVAGIVGAMDDDEVGVVGVAPGARLHAVKVLDSGGYGSLSDIVAGVDWVTKRAHTIEIANMSLGLTGQSDALRTAIQNAVGAGILVTVSAGNESIDVYGPDGTFGTNDDVIPAAYPEVMTISAMTDYDGKPGGLGSPDVDDTSYDGPDDSFANYSNFSASVIAENPVTSPGASIDLMMPGSDIWSTWNDGWSAVQMSGTSMAAPHAAGLAALYMAEQGSSPTDATEVASVRQALIDNAMPQTDSGGLALQNDPDGNPEPIGWAVPLGPIDLAPTVEITHPVEGSLVSGTTVSLTASASDDGSVTGVVFEISDGSTTQTLPANDDGNGVWTASWDTTASTEDQSYTITATATDDATQSTTSSGVTVTVDNTPEAPSVQISSPTEGETLSGTVTITAEAFDDIGVEQVAFAVVDGARIATDTDGTDGWTASWDTTNIVDGTIVSITATATDGREQHTTSTAVSVTVDQPEVTETSMHVADLSATKTLMGRSGKWQSHVTVSVLDASANAIAGATVEGSWDYDSTTVSAITDSNGEANFTSAELRNVESMTLTITDIVGPDSTYVYDSTGNVGSSITVYYSSDTPTISSGSTTEAAFLYWNDLESDQQDEEEDDPLADPALADLALMMM